MATGSKIRGVRASRRKLTAALTGSNLPRKTQAALAQRMADLEGLDSIPKDLVSRVFREQPVDPVTLERIARALEVDAFSLYLTQEDVTTTSDINEQKQDRVKPARSRFHYWIRGGSLAAITLAALVSWLLISGDHSHQNVPTLGKPGLLIAPNSTAQFGFSERLSDSLSKNFHASVLPQHLIQPQLSTSLLLEDFESDLVLLVKSEPQGRYILVEFLLDDGTHRSRVMTMAMSKAEWRAINADIIRWVGEELDKRTGIFANSSVETPAIPLSVYRHYIQARQLQEDSAYKGALDKAHTVLEQAQWYSDAYGPLHAALCASHIYRRFQENEKAALEEASSHCERAIELAPWHPHVQLTLGHLYQVSGQELRAQAHYQALLEQWPEYSQLLVKMAQVNLNLYSKTGEDSYYIQSVSYADKAVEASKNDWRPYQNRAVVAFYGGDVSAAMDYLDRSVAIEPSLLSLSNIGAVHTCQGKLNEAISHLSTATEQAPGEYAPLEMLATATFFNGDFDAAAQMMEKVLSLVGENSVIHGQWGVAADAFWFAGQKEKARSLYNHALITLEKDKLRGEVSNASLVSQLYYQLRLGSSPTDRQLSSLIDLPADQLEATALYTLAKVYHALGDDDQSHSYANLASKHCSVYNGFLQHYVFERTVQAHQSASSPSSR